MLLFSSLKLKLLIKYSLRRSVVFQELQQVFTEVQVSSASIKILPDTLFLHAKHLIEHVAKNNDFLRTINLADVLFELIGMRQ